MVFLSSAPTRGCREATCSITSERRLVLEEAGGVRSLEVGAQLRANLRRALPVQDPLQCARTRRSAALSGVGTEPWPGRPCVRRRTQNGIFSATPICISGRSTPKARVLPRPPSLITHTQSITSGCSLREELRAVDAARLLVRDGDEGEVAAQRQLVAMVQQESDELHDAHPLHVERAAAPDVALAHLAAERVDGPVLALEGHDVGVVEQDQLLAARAVAGQRGDERGAAGRVRRLVEPVGDALAIEDRAVEVAGARLVAGRVDGVDADVGGEQLRRFLGQRVPVRRESVVRHAVLLESSLPHPAPARANLPPPAGARVHARSGRSTPAFRSPGWGPDSARRSRPRSAASLPRSVPARRAGGRTGRCGWAATDRRPRRGRP